MPSLGTPAASKAQTERLAKGVVAYGVAKYSPSDTQAVWLDSNAGTTTAKASVLHAAYPAQLAWVVDAKLTGAKGKKLDVAVVSKTSTALKGLNGKNNVNVQQNVTFNDPNNNGFASMMLNNITVDKIPKVVLKLLKKLVPALKKKPDDVDLAAGAVTASVGSLAEFYGLPTFAAYDATSGKAALVYYME